MILGLGLLLFALVAPLWPAEAQPPARSEVVGLPGYDQRVRGSRELLRSLRTPAEPSTVEHLNRLVFESLAHGDPAPIGATQNWLAYCTGLVHPDLALTQDPERLARGGIGLCSDAVIVLLAVARRAGYEAQMVDLGGHLVARVAHDGREWLADPDFGVVFPGTLAELEQPDRLAQVEAALLAAGHSPRRVAQHVAALGSAEDNRILPAGVLSPRLALAERALDVLAWLLPLLLALACGARLVRGQ